MVKKFHVILCKCVCISNDACSSSLCNISCSAIAKSSFVDYIKGGCELNLIVAIDFTVRSDIMSNVCVNIVIGLQW